MMGFGCKEEKDADVRLSGACLCPYFPIFVSFFAQLLWAGCSLGWIGLLGEEENNADIYFHIMSALCLAHCRTIYIPHIFNNIYLITHIFDNTYISNLTFYLEPLAFGCVGSNFLDRIVSELSILATVSDYSVCYKPLLTSCRISDGYR